MGDPSSREAHLWYHGRLVTVEVIDSLLNVSVGVLPNGHLVLLLALVAQQPNGATHVLSMWNSLNTVPVGNEHEGAH